MDTSVDPVAPAPDPAADPAAPVTLVDVAPPGTVAAPAFTAAAPSATDVTPALAPARGNGPVRDLHLQVERESGFLDDVVAEVGKVVIGQTQMIERILIGLLANGHCLIEGVPGLAKTLTVKTLSQTIAATFQRIQFTPDLLPADITGTTIYNMQTGRVHPEEGPAVRQPGPGRRDQPRPGQGAVGAARGDAGAPGHDRRHHPSACPIRSWCWRRRTRSSRRAPTRCPRRSSIASS
jgi:hypothetical protein